MLTYLQSLKLYSFITFLILSFSLVFGVCFFALLFIILRLSSQFWSGFPKMILALSLVFFGFFLLISVKNIFFSSLQKKFQNFQLNNTENTWGRFLKIYVPTSFSTMFISFVVEGLVSYVECKSFSQTQPSTFAILCSLISDFLSGAYFLSYFLKLNGVTKKNSCF
jgi:hypothetical protein